MEAVTSLEMGVPAVPVQWQVKPLPIQSVVSAMQLGLLPEVATVALYYKQVEWNAGAVGAMDRWETGVLVTIPLLVLLIQLGNKQFKSIPEQTMFALSKIPWVRYGVGATMLMGKLVTIIP